MFKPYHTQKDDPSKGQSSLAPIIITASHDREVENIIDYQARQKQGKRTIAMFLIHWKEQSPEKAT